MGTVNRHDKGTPTATRKASVHTETYSGDQRILSIRLRNGDVTVDVTNMGCAITAIHTPDRNGLQTNIVAGYTDLEEYKHNRDYLGVVVGRYANRIAGGQFSLQGKEYTLTINDGPNHLHGGASGFDQKIWDLLSVQEADDTCHVAFGYTSPDGEEGYPGTLSVVVTYTLDSAGRLGIHYEATCDQSTPVNLTNHSYFNLTGFEYPTIYEHALQVNADSFTEKNGHNTPSGKVLPVEHTALDFRLVKKLKQGITCFPADMGYDHNFVLQCSAAGALVKAAVLSEATTGRTLTVYTDRPAMQVYTANYWNGTIRGRQGYAYRQHGGIALETQAYPDSVHHAHFPDTILHPGERYVSTTIFEFGIEPL